MFRNFSKIAILSTLIALFLSACSYKYRSANTYDSTNNSNLNKEYNKIRDARDHLDIADDMQKHVISQTTLEATIASLSTQLMQNKKINTDKPVLITSFVRLDQLKETSEFGRVLGESLINDLSNRGFNVIEYRGQMAVSINDKGEYFISRKPHEIKDTAPNTYVVVGTYSRQAGKVILNARIIDNISGKIITSARSTYLHNLANDCTLFKDCSPARTIKIVKEK